MAIKLPSGFKVSVQEPIDNRLVMTKAEMLAAIDARMPSNYVCVCKDDGKLYIWNSNFSSDPTIGKFRVYEDVMDMSAALNKAMESPSTKAALESAIAQTLPGSIKTALEDEELGSELVDNMFDSEHFQKNVDNKIDIAISLIQAIDSN